MMEQRYVTRFAQWLIGLIATAGAAVLPVAAADYPDRPIRLVVPFPAGGGADTLARLIMPRVAQGLGAPIVIDNKPGAGGNVGAEIVARAQRSTRASTAACGSIRSGISRRFRG